MKRISMFAAALLLSTSANAQTLTPTPPSGSIALATDIAAKIFPDGTYRRIMGGSMTAMMDNMVGQMSNMRISPLLKSSGLPAGDAARLGKTTLRQIMEISDPDYTKRMQIIMSVTMDEAGRIMSRFEPEMREGLAESYATRFSGEQLADIDRFMNTPSGRAFAAQSMTMSSDPAVVRRMQAFLPTLVQSMPAILEKATAATAGLPKAKTYAELSDADRAKLAQLLGASSTKPVLHPAAPSPRPGSGMLRPNASPTPNDDLGRHFGPDHYPPEAMRSESQGRVVAELAIDTGGRVTACALESSSGSGALDAATCRIATDDLTFSPATDSRSKPIKGTFRLAVRWVLPPDAPAPPPPG